MASQPSARRRAMARIFAAILAASLGLAAASASAAGVLVFAAASLSDALEVVAQPFTEETGIAVTVSYGGTSVLARQIEQGAPAGIFVSADIAWMDYLEERGLIDHGSRTGLLGNQLVLVAPTGARLGPNSDIGSLITDGIGPGQLLAMANIVAVPAGRYGKSALEALGVWSAVAPFVAQTENVRGALAFVARGETPLGIVYATDALAEPDVDVVATFAADLHPEIVYPAALTNTGRESADAEAFFLYLTGPEAAAIFAQFGFLTPLASP